MSTTPSSNQFPESRTITDYFPTSCSMDGAYCLLLEKLEQHFEK